MPIADKQFNLDAGLLNPNRASLVGFKNNHLI
jgi:hypothetical protein